MGIRPGTIVRFSFEPGWAEVGVVTDVSRGSNPADDLVTVALDNVVELPGHLGGGWCAEVQRHRHELETVA